MGKMYRLAALTLSLCCTVFCQAPTKVPPKAVTASDFKIRVVVDEVSAADWSQGFQSVAYQQKGPALQATEEQRLQLTFGIVDGAGATVQPQQVFVRLASPHKEVILLPDVDGSNYKLDVDLKTKAKLFDNLNGKYELSLIVGDAKIKSFLWSITDLELKFSQPGSPVEDYFARKADIVHTFRQPEKRPPAFVSNVFCLVIMGLFGLMLLLWMRVGLSLSGVTASSLLFQVSLGAILYIEYLFYLGNNMFTTLRYLTWAAPFALYFGRRMLSNLAKAESHH